jgi:hypothetical protein
MDLLIHAIRQHRIGLIFVVIGLPVGKNLTAIIVRMNRPSFVLFFSIGIFCRRGFRMGGRLAS